MSAAEALHPEEHHEEAAHPHEAANNSEYFEEGGIFPLIGQIAGLVKGIAIDAPIKTFAGEKAKAHGAHAAHGSHDKADHKDEKHDKKDGHDKEGHDKDAHDKAHHKEASEDLWAAAKSTGEVLENLMDGKVDKHQLEHAVDHWLDARDLGRVRPFAGPIARVVEWGLGKMFTIRDHALEKLDPQWDTLGRQILTGLKKDPKHGYHSSVENLCHTMENTDLQEKFGKFLADGPFEKALDSESGRTALKKQLERMLGTSEQPHPDELNKRIDAILKILSLEHEHQEGLWSRFKKAVGIGHAAPHAPAHGAAHGAGHGHAAHHPHEHDLDDKKAQANLALLRDVLKRMKEKCTEGNLDMIYQGKKQKIDYDKFGDEVDEKVTDSQESRTSFITSFEPTSFKNKFKTLLEPARLKTKLKTPEARQEVCDLLRIIFDLEKNSKIGSAGELQTEIDELIGPHGKLKEASNYPANSIAQTKFNQLKAFIDTIKTNLAAASPLPDQNGKSIIEVVYEDKLTVTYDKFGFQLKALEPEKAAAYLSAYKPEEFADAFRTIRVEANLRKAVAKEESRKAAQAELLNFLGLPPGNVEEMDITTKLTNWEARLSPAAVPPLDVKYQQWKADVESIKNLLQGQLLKDLNEGPQKAFMIELQENTTAVITKLRTGAGKYGFLTKYAEILKGSAEEIDAKAAKEQVKQFFGLENPSVAFVRSSLEDAIRSLPASGAEELGMLLEKVKETLTAENLQKISQ